MVRTPAPLLLAVASYVLPATAVILYAADSAGSVSTLSLDGSCGNYSLTLVSSTRDCQPNPAVLNFDSDNRVLYCYDRGAGSSQSGSLNSFTADEDGVLAHVARVAAPLSGVAGEIVTSPSGARAYVSSSYNKSAVGVFALEEDGALPGTGPLQTILPTIESHGPVPVRQDASYLHHVINDPTGKYVLIPDLGGDRVRVYTYDEAKIAPLVEIAGLTADPGSGPRHGFFRTAANGDMFFFFNGELSQKVYSYRVEYAKTGLRFTKVFETPAISADLPETKAPTSEIAMSPDGRFLIVSNRDVSFRDSPILGSGPSDTLSTFAINEDGTVELVQLAPSGGWSPRQFAFNKRGDKIAVGHQNNRTVVIWERNLETGEVVLEENGGKLAEITLTGAVVVSIWDE